MSEHTRFAIYFVPPRGALYDFGASWLGWDSARAAAVAQPDVDGIADFTATPRKYGFHATLKPPFRLAPGFTVADLHEAAALLAKRTAPAASGPLGLSRLGRFLALTPTGAEDGINRVAAACVADLDRFRAPATAEEIARRKGPGLSPVQDALLQRWGYPHVMEAFRFHMTLTGRLAPADLDRVADFLQTRLPMPDDPFHLDGITMLGERADGFFEVLHRYALTG